MEIFGHFIENLDSSDDNLVFSFFRTIGSGEEGGSMTDRTANQIK